MTSSPHVRTRHAASMPDPFGGPRLPSPPPFALPPSRALRARSRAPLRTLRAHEIVAACPGAVRRLRGATVSRRICGSLFAPCRAALGTSHRPRSAPHPLQKRFLDHCAGHSGRACGRARCAAVRSWLDTSTCCELSRPHREATPRHRLRSDDTTATERLAASSQALAAPQSCLAFSLFVRAALPPISRASTLSRLSIRCNKPRATAPRCSATTRCSPTLLPACSSSFAFDSIRAVRFRALANSVSHSTARRSGRRSAVAFCDDTLSHMPRRPPPVHPVFSQASGRALSHWIGEVAGSSLGGASFSLKHLCKDLVLSFIVIGSRRVITLS